MAKRKQAKGARRGQNPAASGNPAKRDQAPLGPSCSVCQEPLSAGEKFCRSCGAKVDEKKAAGQPATAASATKAQSRDADDRSTSDANGPGGDSPAAGSESKKTESGNGPNVVPPDNALPWRKFAFAGAIAAVILIVGAVVVLNSTGSSSTSATEEDVYSELDNPTTQTDAAADKPAVDNGKLPDATRREMQASIKKLIRRHHQLIADGDYAGAFALYSNRKKSRPLYDTPSCRSYTCWQSVMYPLNSGMVKPVRPTVSVARTFKRSGVAEIRVSIPMPSCPTGAWEGITWAKYEGGRWTYDAGWKTDEGQRAEYASTNGGNTQDPRLLGVGCDS
jgi:hypothetical protein